MEIGKTKLALTASALAMALMLAGCGGSSSSGGVSSAAGGGSGGGGAPPPQQPLPETEAEKNEKLLGAADTAEDALGTETSALTTLAAAVDKAGSARMMAKKYSEMLETLKVDGNSKAAMDNAAMVLQAKMDLMSAITDTGAAIDALVTARDALPDGTDVAEINKAITDAEKLVEDAQKVHDGDELAKFVNEVTGGPKADPQGTAKSIGEDVAMDIAMALAPMTPEGGSATPVGTSVRVTRATSTSTTVRPTALAGIDEANKYQAPVSKDSKSMSWAELAGATAELMDRQVVAGSPNDAATHTVKVASIAGMKVTDVFGSTVTELAAAAKVNGAETAVAAGSGYKGIPGTVICGGTDCAAEGGKLTGSWYFTPTLPMAIYMKGTDDETTTEVDESKLYVRDTMIATYGHWLTVSGADATVHTYAYSSANTQSLFFDVDQASKNSDLKSDTATYSGNAAGRSVHKTFDPNGKMTDIQSGRFTANVMLTAKFGDNPMLGGTVSGFMSPDNPDAVDSNWTVELKDTGVDETAGTLASSNTGMTVGMTGDDPGQAGAWSANAYGQAPRTVEGVEVSYRPTGIFGDFNAHFTDGHVAGAYATRKQ